MIPFDAELRHGEPVYEQLISAVRRALFAGQLKDGDAFPSVRALSQELKISPTTAHKVVSFLKTEGFLASRPGIGMVVTAAALPDTGQRLSLLNDQVEKLIRDARGLSLSLEDLRGELGRQWAPPEDR